MSKKRKNTDDIDVNVDKNISFNIRSIKSGDSQTEGIIKALLYYISYSLFEEIYTEDLFGFKTLDPHEFAGLMQINKTNLWRKHPNPAWKTDNPKSSQVFYDSYLGNALYILSTQNFIQHYQYSDGNRNVAGVKNFLFIEELQEISMPANRGRTKKICYRYKIDPKFEKNLKEFFMKSNLSNFIKSKSKNNENFYLYIKNLYHSYRGDRDQHYLKFREVMDYMKIERELTSENKKFIKREINKKFRDIEEYVKNEIPGLKFGWDKAKNQKYAYVPYIKWDPIDKVKLNEENYKDVMSTFKKTLRKALYVQYIEKCDNPIFSEEAFFAWIIDRKNYVNICDSYDETFNFFYKKNRNQNDITHTQVRKIQDLQTIEEFNKYFEE